MRWPHVCAVTEGVPTVGSRDHTGRAPEVSIIIPNYNYALYLPDAISSALNQTYPHVEIIVVDDGSTDASVAVAGKYDGIKLISKANGGQSSAIRAALPHVHGDIVIILDSDDVLLPQCCERVCSLWTESVSMIQYKLTKTRYPSGEVIGEYPDRPFLRHGLRKHVLEHGDIPASPTTGNAFSAAHVREAFRYNRDRDRAFADGYLIFTAPLVGDVLQIDESLAIYRIHGANVSMSSGKGGIKKIRNYFQTNLDHRIGLSGYARRLCMSSKSAIDYLGPYNWRAAIYLKRLDPSSVSSLGLSRVEMLIRGIVAFTRYPGIRLEKRLRNIAGLLAISAAPKPFVAKIVS